MNMKVKEVKGPLKARKVMPQVSCKLTSKLSKDKDQ